MQTLRPPWVLTQARAHRPADRAWPHFSSATRRPAIWVWPTRPPGRARADDGLPAVLQRQDRTECALADVPASFAARPPELLVRRAANRLSQQRGCRAERRLRARSAQQLSVTHRDGHCWGRPGCRGTTRGTGTSRTPVQCVLSGHSLAASVQVGRPERPVGPLLIRGFGVRVPGGAPGGIHTSPACMLTFGSDILLSASMILPWRLPGCLWASLQALSVLVDGCERAGPCWRAGLLCAATVLAVAVVMARGRAGRGWCGVVCGCGAAGRRRRGGCCLAAGCCRRPGCAGCGLRAGRRATG